MKHVFFLISLFISLSFTFGQISVQDSVSGGSYNVYASQEIQDLIQNSIQTKCTNIAENEAEIDLENFDPCAQNSKVMGYKIQIMYTKDRNLANRAQADFAEKFPSLVPEMVYTRPDYRVIAGDYFTKRSAASDLAMVKREYPGAFLIQWRVWCRRAK